MDIELRALYGLWIDAPEYHRLIGRWEQIRNKFEFKNSHQYSDKLEDLVSIHFCNPDSIPGLYTFSDGSYEQFCVGFDLREDVIGEYYFVEISEFTFFKKIQNQVEPEMDKLIDQIIERVYFDEPGQIALLKTKEKKLLAHFWIPY